MPDVPPPRQVDSWEAAADNAVLWMRHWGVADAHRPPPGEGYGADLRAAHALAQVRYEPVAVDAGTVQQLVGARGHGTQALFCFSGSGYEPQATEYADVMGVALFTYDRLGRPEARNGAARRVLSTSSANPLATREQDVAAPQWPAAHAVQPVDPALFVRRRASVSPSTAVIAIAAFFLVGGLGMALDRDSTSAGEILGGIAMVLVATFALGLAVRHKVVDWQAKRDAED